MALDLSDYVPVAERIAKLRADHPDARLRVIERELVEIPGVGWGWVVVAACYLSADDALPGLGSAWEPVPGKTPYTRDSELQNAETSAWGRAIVAALAADTARGIASADEVAARTGEEPVRRASENQIRALIAAVETHGLPDGMEWPDESKLTMREASDLIDRVRALPPLTAPNVRVPTVREDSTVPADAASPSPGTVDNPPQVATPDPEGDDVRPWNRRPFPFDAPEAQRLRYWTVAIAAVPGIGVIRFLQNARDIAEERGLPLPASIDEITDPELVDAVRKWLDARADEKGVPV